MAGIENRHIIFFCQTIDRGKQRAEILLRVDVFLPMGRQQNVFPLFQSQAGMDIAALDFGEIFMQHLCHGGAGHIAAFFRKPAVCQISSGVFAVCHIDIRNDVNDPPVRLFRQALILAPVARLHVENRNVQAFGADGRQTGVGIPQDQQRIRL